MGGGVNWKKIFVCHTYTITQLCNKPDSAKNLNRVHFPLVSHLQEQVLCIQSLANKNDSGRA